MIDVTVSEKVPTIEENLDPPGVALNWKMPAVVQEMVVVRVEPEGNAGIDAVQFMTCDEPKKISVALHVKVMTRAART